MANVHAQRLRRDLLVVAISVLFAILLAKSGILDSLFSAVSGHYVLASFVAGLFFTSSFTTAPAIVVLSRLCTAFPSLHVALAGALGALVGDLLIFSLIKSHVAEDVAYVLSKAKIKRIAHALRYHTVRWLMALVGALIIASPLPDELGLALMGVSRLATWKFCLTSYCFNFLGIALIGFVARSAIGG